MAEKKRIEGKIAQLLNERELVINRGTEDGVEIGMRFAILNPKGLDIKDPDTGKKLGSVELSKTLVKVVQVQPSMAVGRTFREFRTRGGALYSIAASAALAGMSSPPQSRVETLRTDESLVAKEINEADSLVKIGDTAVQLVDDGMVGATDSAE